jgi:glycosyltransferase involved in cell wall biosynthesis
MAPEAFYEDRGTPIAVNLLLRVLAERHERIDLVTYHRGRSVTHENLTIHRILNIPFIKHIPPGLSWQKLVCDVFMTTKVIRLAIRKRYDILHCVEDSVFMGLLLKLLFGYRYVYDMDSSMAQQIVEKYPRLAPLGGALRMFEKTAVRGSEVVLPVCESLATLVETYEPKKIVLLRDVSLLSLQEESREFGELPSGVEGPIVMYIGNLEGYQGIDLLIDSFALSVRRGSGRGSLVIIGGSERDIKKYEEKCDNLGIAEKVHFLGSRPIEHLRNYLLQADILVSPRLKGKNTPMKIYSYLHSGRAVLATDVESHREVLNRGVASLAPPSVDGFAREMSALMENELLRSQLGAAGKRLAETKYSWETFRHDVNGLYDWLKMRVADGAGSGDGGGADRTRTGGGNGR